MHLLTTRGRLEPPPLKMSIDTSEHPPIAKKTYALAPKHYDSVRMRFTNYLKQVSFKKATPGWSAPIVVVPKGDGGKSLCMDFRALNAITRTYVWPMPRVRDIFAKLGKAKFFTTLNLRSGYHHIALDDDAIRKTAFVAPMGKYKYLNVPFGFSSSTHILSKSQEQGSKWAALYLGLPR